MPSSSRSPPVSPNAALRGAVSASRKAKRLELLGFGAARESARIGGGIL
uniref:Uncharacterized protein n=1 Tax=Setaria italica TaxID=4555 RepID=K3ZPM7_SETIT